MLNLLVRYKILTNVGSGLTTGNYVNVYWDDTSDVIEVQKFDDGSDTTGTVITTGPDIGARDINHRVISGLVIDELGFTSNFCEYRFCDGTTLNLFYAVSSFPYASQLTSAGHASCTVDVVCDLQIADDFTTVSASDSVTADGEISVSATSSNGTIKFAVDNPSFDYTTEGQTSGSFTGLFSGVHTVTAKDPSGCFDQITVTIGLPTTYGPLYRTEYIDINQVYTRVDILERGYSGAITEVKGFGNSPFILKYNADGDLDKFRPIVPSEARLSLTSETNFQFIGLFTQDDRKYQMRYYKSTDDVTYVEHWRGFLLSDNYSEAYLSPPYGVEIVATDGLADLKSYDFVDADGNRYRDDIVTLKAITEILLKTGLEINIQCGINRYEADMDSGAGDDPLDQCKFNPTTFYDGDSVDNCYEVLEQILKPFGARILQRMGKWFITSVEELADSIDYREFDYTGAYVSNSSIDDIVDIDTPIVQLRAAFRDRVQTLETVPAFGTMFFEHELIKNTSLVSSYGFENTDTYQDATGLTRFKDWNVNILYAPGVTVGIKETKALEGNYNFYLTGIEGNLSGGTWTPTGGKRLILTQKTFDIEHDSTDIFELSFDYSILIFYAGYLSDPHWVRIKWKFKVGSYYYIDGVGWDTSPADVYNSVYVNSFEKTNNFKVRANFRENVADALTEDAILEFVFEGRNGHDFTITSGAGFDNLRAIDTVDLPIGTKVKGYENYSDTGFYYYILESGTDAESTPDIVRPDDYHGTTNTKFWSLEKYEQFAKNVTYVYFDNVILTHFPRGTEQKNITLERSNNSNIKLEFEGKYKLNDIDIDNINNSERNYKNYFKLLDGTPTQVWERSYRAGSGKLLELLSYDFTSQYRTWTNKLTGSFKSDTEVLPSSCMVETNDDGNKYMFMGYSLDDKNYSIQFDMLQLIDVVTDDESPEIDAGFTVGFSLGFRS